MPSKIAGDIVIKGRDIYEKINSFPGSVLRRRASYPGAGAYAQYKNRPGRLTDHLGGIQYFRNL